MELMELLEFQIYDWNYYHEFPDEEIYVVQLFGRTLDDHDVCLKVTGFRPYFYVEIPENWGQENVNSLIEALRKKVAWKCTDKYEFPVEKSLLEYQLVRGHRFVGFTNKKWYKFIKLSFQSYTGLREFARALDTPVKIMGKPIRLKCYESNIEPHIRLMHLANLSSCGWVAIEKKHLKPLKRYAHCDVVYQVHWQHVKPSGRAEQDTQMASFKILGYDIECVSCDQNFPQACREDDQIIQIGMTLYRYGFLTPESEMILTLKNCCAIKDALVYCYTTERDLLLGFAQKISEMRPDFMVGYNNFGFDDSYIHDRLLRIGGEALLEEFLINLGKLDNRSLVQDGFLKNSLSAYRIKSLSSSALGDNELRFFQVPGIVNIDMMKVIQREYKLNSYKLDSVSANFITEKILEVSEDDTEQEKGVILRTGNIKGLQKHAYIQIMVDDGYTPSPLQEGAKFRVSEISEKGIHIRMETSLLADLKRALRTSKVFWTFAKDDLHYSKINELYREGQPKGIGRIARYCLKDCKLVNLLLARLDIIVNNIGMAKVCHVPLSYLFLRGQGVKIFSLVAKKCREKGYLIPVIRHHVLEDEATYEGATVITPKPGIYTDPIGVLDYSSLYPNSMRERNLSHECYVDDPQYDHLPGYIYHDVFITLKDKNGELLRNLDGTTIKKHYRFAQEIVEDTSSVPEQEKKYFNTSQDRTVRYGILPEILTELLNKRKETNQRLSTEKDPFVRSILNSLQLAYKITANSLYGQTGSPTSPIYLQEIAASTTAIGRERLYFAKKLVEQHFPGAEVIYGDSITADTPILIKDAQDKIRLELVYQLGSGKWESYHEKEYMNVGHLYVPSFMGLWVRIRRLVRHRTFKKIYRVVTTLGTIDVTEDHSLLDERGRIVKPSKCHPGMHLLKLNLLPWVNLSEAPGWMVEQYGLLGREGNFNGVDLNAPKICLQVFLDEFLKNKPDIIVIEGSLNAQKFYIVYIMVYAQSITLTDCKDGKYYFRKCISQYVEVVSSACLGIQDDYVYDLETDSGNFHAGVGLIIVRNTDSIFINFHPQRPQRPQRENADEGNKWALVRTIQLCQEAARLINQNVPPPQCIVYEKTFYPFILLSKKRYVGYLYEQSPDKYYLKSMGIVLKRRDNAPIVKIIVGGIIDHILKRAAMGVPNALELAIHSSVKYVRKVMERLMTGHYSIEKFIISKTLKSRYKNPMAIAHKVLADRMTLRDPGNRPQINDRIPYVYIIRENGNSKDMLQGDLVEHPDYVIQNNLRIDYLYYLKHQIINPVAQFLELMMPAKDVQTLFNEFIIAEENKRLGRQDIQKWVQVFQDNHDMTMTTNAKNSNLCQYKSQDLSKWIQRDA